MVIYNGSQTADRTGAVVEEVTARNVRLQQKRSLQQHQYGGWQPKLETCEASFLNFELTAGFKKPHYYTNFGSLSI
jgi:hypothetical protein